MIFDLEWFFPRQIIQMTNDYTFDDHNPFIEMAGDNLIKIRVHVLAFKS